MQAACLVCSLAHMLVLVCCLRSWRGLGTPSKPPRHSTNTSCLLHWNTFWPPAATVSWGSAPNPKVNTGALVTPGLQGPRLHVLHVLVKYLLLLLVLCLLSLYLNGLLELLVYVLYACRVDRRTRKRNQEIRNLPDSCSWSLVYLRERTFTLPTVVRVGVYIYYT